MTGDRIGSRGVFDPKEAHALLGAQCLKGLKVFVRYMATTRVE